MDLVWSINVDTLEEFFTVIKTVENELKKSLTRDERELVFIEFMKLKSIKPVGGTELTKEEMWSQLVQDGKTILNIDKDGYKIIKKKEDNKMES